MKKFPVFFVPFLVLASGVLAGVKNYPVPFVGSRTIDAPASVLRVTEAPETTTDAVFSTSWTVTMGATGVSKSIFGYITSDGVQTGVGHFVGVFGQADVKSTGQQFAIGIEGLANSQSQYATGDAIGAVGHAIWASDASTGTTANIIGMNALAEVYNADGVTERSTGTVIGLNIDASVGGATKYGIFQAGANDTNLFAGPVYASSGIVNSGSFRSVVQLETVADNGNGGTPATATVTPTRDYILITCNDAQGCTITLSETGAADGKRVTIVGASANAATINDSSGVTELAGNCALSTYDTLNLIYVANAWAEVSRSNN